MEYIRFRAHRTTSYDVAVTVTSVESLRSSPKKVTANPKMMMAYKASTGRGAVEAAGVDDSTVKKPRMNGFWRQGSEVGTESVISSSTTKITSNQSPSSHIHFRDNHHSQHNDIKATNHASIGPNTDEHSITSSITGASTQPKQTNNSSPSIMSAIGGAFGGLLSRRVGKNSSSSDGDEDHHTRTTHLNDARHSYQHISTKPPSDNNQPYDQVVSAPSGRIGVTFVQFRGHAVVSDIAPDSPLLGWVFPSDILIAIDEVPVSGMRVRDIVKLLTARGERQRALRMISTHAMTELTNGDV